MENDLLYRLALSRIPGIGPVFAKKLIRHFGGARAIFRAEAPVLEKICGKKGASAIVNFKEFQELEKEQSFLEKYAIRPLFITDKDYPQRLLSCKNAPVLLFYKGNTDLNARKIIAIVGTRSPTEYGKQAATRLVKELAASMSSLSGPASPGPLIVSGLAYGIDAIAHQAALDNNLPTVGILGHGLDRIYPQQHTSLAKKMVKQGGLLTKFNSNTRPENYHFPARNQIVAGMSDALIVVETDSKGGSMLTVENALTYKKKIFAFPGRINDPKSSGCNELIRQGKACLLTGARQLMEDMKWEQPVTKPGLEQAALFPAPGEESILSEDEKQLLHLLREQDMLSLDKLASDSHRPGNALALALLNLELQGWIDSLPGKRYRLRQ
jgi:DNA processing protein